MEKHAILGPYPPPFEGVGIVAKQEHCRTGGLFIGTSREPLQNVPDVDLIKKSSFIFDIPRLLWKILKHKREISVINAHFATTYGFIAYLAKKLFRVKYTVTCHGSDILINLRKSPHKWLTKLALENAEEIFVVSRVLKRRMIGEGVKNTAIQIKRSKLASCFKPMKNVKKKKQIITVGTIYRRKGYRTLLKAFAQIADKFPKYKLVIVGRVESASYMKELEKIIHEKGLQERVEFLGEQEEISLLLNESELFVMPSRSEGYGLALAEALACKLPCIASDLGGIREVVGNSRKCTLFPVGNINELASAMKNRLEKH